MMYRETGIHYVLLIRTPPQKELILFYRNMYLTEDQALGYDSFHGGLLSHDTYERKIVESLYFFLVCQKCPPPPH